MSSTTNGMCGTEGSRLAERLDIQPFQGWGVGPTPTPGCAPLALGSGIQPHRGLRSKAYRNLENDRMAAEPSCFTGRERAMNRPRRFNGRCSREGQKLIEGRR